MKKTITTILAIASMAILTACVPGYSNGSRVGYVNKLSNKGIICKSWEGEMNLGGFRNSTDSNGNTQVVANTFLFSVKDEALVKRISAAMEEGKRVELVYTQWLIPPITQDSSYTIIDVK